MEAQKVMVPATGHRAGLGSQPGPVSHTPNYQGINSLMLSFLMPLNLMCPPKYPCLHFSTGKLLLTLQCPLDVASLRLLSRQTPPASSLFLGLPPKPQANACLGSVLWVCYCLCQYLSSPLCPSVPRQRALAAWLILQVGDRSSGSGAGS